MGIIDDISLEDRQKYGSAFCIQIGNDDMIMTFWSLASSYLMFKCFAEWVLRYKDKLESWYEICQEIPDCDYSQKLAEVIDLKEGERFIWSIIRFYYSGELYEEEEEWNRLEDEGEGDWLPFG